MLCVRAQVSYMGDPKGEPRGGFLLFDQHLQLTGEWTGERAPFGYDFWYQPHAGVMVSSGWGAPATFSKGFNPDDVAKGRYADALYVWDWRARTLAQTIHLGADGVVPLETRFLHNPDATAGFVGAALASNVLRFHKQPQPDAPETPAAGGGKPASSGGVGTWAAEVAIRQEWVPVSGWALEKMPPLISDILISLDDRFLFFSNWLRGDICQYDISDPAAPPKLVGQLFLGGSIRAGGPVTVTDGPFCGKQPEAPRVRGKQLPGGPQMLQLRCAHRMRDSLASCACGATRLPLTRRCLLYIAPACPLQPGWHASVRDELAVQPLGRAVLPRDAHARQLDGAPARGHRQGRLVARRKFSDRFQRRAGRAWAAGARDPLPGRRLHQRHLVLKRRAGALAGTKRSEQFWTLAADAFVRRGCAAGAAMLPTMRAQRPPVLQRLCGSMVAHALITRDACLAKARSNAASAVHGLLRVQRRCSEAPEAGGRKGAEQVVTARFERQPAGTRRTRAS
jgi:hypothetical protein